MRRIPNAARLGGLLALSLLAVLAGCSKKSSNPVAPVVPSSANVNGYQLTSTPGNVEMNVSTVMSNGSLMSSATLTEPTLSNLAIGTAPRTMVRYSPYSVVTGSAAVCGSINSQSAIVATICLDATGSMSSSDPNQLRKTAAKSFVGLLGSSDLASVGSFDTDTDPTAGLLALHLYAGGTFTANHTTLSACVDSATFDGGSTPLWDAAYDCVTHDVAHGGSNLLSLVLTDGGDNSSSMIASDVVTYATAHSVHMYMVGLDADGSLDGAPEDSMRFVAQQTGGFYARADSASQISKLFGNVFNASHASGCVSATFHVDGAVPVAGTVVTGTLTFKANGTAVSGPFRIVF